MCIKLVTETSLYLSSVCLQWVPEMSSFFLPHTKIHVYMGYKQGEDECYSLHVCTVHQQYQGTFLLFLTDAHNYKIIGIFKQLKF